MGEHSFGYYSVLEAEEEFLNDLEQVAEIEQLDDRTRRALMLTLSEAFTNALVHGNGLDPEKKVKVKVRVYEGMVEAEVSDEGRGGLEKLAHRPEAGRWDDHGRGIGLIEHYAGEVAYGESETGGLKVSVRFGRLVERRGD